MKEAEMIENIIHPADIYTEVTEAISARYGKPKELSISFLPTLNDKIWGLNKRKLVVVAGRPSMGKSTLLLQMAYAFAEQGKRVFFFSLEMPKETCVERLICNQCGISNYLTRTGKLEEEIEKYHSKLNGFYNRLKNTQLVLIENWGKTFLQIREVIETLDRPDVVIIDHINRIKKDRVTEKESIDKYIMDLRTMALNKDFCAIIGAQINREVHKTKDNEVKSPNLWHLKGSGGIEEDADVCFILHWEYFYTREEGTENDYLIKVVKNRDGRTGEFDCIFEPEFYRIGEKRERTERLI